MGEHDLGFDPGAQWVIGVDVLGEHASAFLGEVVSLDTVENLQCRVC